MKHTLLIRCKDQKGLIHQISGVFYRHKANVTENAEFVDHLNEKFFMRTEIEGDLNRIEVENELKKILPVQSTFTFRKHSKRRILILATREHHCLGDLLQRNHFNELDGKIVGVLSQYSDLKDLVSRFDIPFECIAVNQLSREQHEEELVSRIDALAPDLIILAKYMRVFTPKFVKKYGAKTINIHHSFLPAFVGKEPYAQAFERGVKIIGATAHFVSEELDQGPIITQDVIPVNHTMDSKDLARAGRDIEKNVLARAVQLALEDRIIVDGVRTVIFS